jgi:DNA-binding transcriptional MerR regulator
MAEPDAAWTIDQLSELVARVLSSGYPGQASGRVRHVPDVRTIRWYTSIGLLDRPAAMRGRTALYGRRHLAQLVAVKRLQADGHALAEVQRQLIGADDATLERVARLGELDGAVRREAVPEVAPELEPESEPGPARDRFWSAPARPSRLPNVPHALNAPHASNAPNTEAYTDPPAALVHAIRLAPDVTLLLEHADAPPNAEELAALTQAARPLLDALRALGLTTTTTGRPARGAVRRGTTR